MSVPDDAVTPTPDEVPDPVEATAPRADPPPDEDLTGQPDEEGTILPVPGNRGGNGVA
ncbi:hypothetical protein J1G42_03150 [Cellulomonas sp. zg-ZUI222]|uniref:Uncharacterized protein n=1 Tax=Cellulomonas wangleii TaxID=2816956 RepID=A0ABX8D8H4_9CELL|nr:MULTISPECIES: hypothetical protein [Cellulomonas]MBO0898971.1 hypothetical protein [Cellulomonas sp. zg-ZUI22]MBO0919823.1 hypothetical protein [Cellulomonas wangleii]MBO0923742.1 hypothetical protein [Cellulomonas wangleii]MBO0924024.1 hypothetical protein [Cellulomonas wangleii]QVI62052.1 hypothetical protein KG103_16815 [Cellulomonas wangleii]